MLKTRRKKNVKKGIQFCLMVCGASGTGTLRRGHDTLGAIS
jgi:septin family protein